MNFSQDSSLTAAFYRETDRARREALLTTLREDLEDQALSDRMASVFHARYETLPHRSFFSQSRAEAVPSDRYIRGILLLTMVPGTTSGRVKKRDSEQIDRALAEFLPPVDPSVAETPMDGGPFSRIPGYELYNACLLYLSLCQKDEHYASVALGFGRRKPASLEAKIAADVRRMTETIPALYGKEQEMAAFSAAMREAFSDTCRGSEDLHQ